MTKSMQNQHNEKYLMVFVSCPTQETGLMLAKLLVERKIAACVQLSSPVISVYQWENKICQEQECCLQIKCIDTCYLAIEQLIKKHHPYEVPEIIAMPITKGLPEYLNWIKNNSQQ